LEEASSADDFYDATTDGVDALKDQMLLMLKHRNINIKTNGIDGISDNLQRTSLL
jgi:hypothetical protein